MHRGADSAGCRVAGLCFQKLPHMNLHPIPFELCYICLSITLLLYNEQDPPISFLLFLTLLGSGPRGVDDLCYVFSSSSSSVHPPARHSTIFCHIMLNSAKFCQFLPKSAKFCLFLPKLAIPPSFQEEDKEEEKIPHMCESI